MTASTWKAWWRGLLLLAAIGLALPATGSGPAVRIESEHKLSVPLDCGEEVWGYLNDRFASGATFRLGEDGTSFTASLSEEVFVDTYFDTASLDLAKQQSGVRRRIRMIPNDPTHKKHERQLLQIKLARTGGPSTHRSEIKLRIKDGIGPDEGNERGPVALLAKSSDRRALEHEMEALGVDAATLKPTLTLTQTRRRVYIEDGEGPFATITFDEVEAARRGTRVRFLETELELNEKRFTRGDDRERAKMEELNGLILEELQAKFAFMTVDQTPKYNKALEALGDRALTDRSLEGRTARAMSVLTIDGGPR